MDTTLANTANGANGANGHQPGHGEEMDTDENRDTTRTALLEIMEERAARILEHEKDISAVERVLAILDAGQGAGAHAGEEALGTTEETGPKPGDGETEEKGRRRNGSGNRRRYRSGGAHRPRGPDLGP